MEMTTIIDWQECIAKTNQQKTLALELLTLLDEQIQTELPLLKQSLHEEKLPECHDIIHGILGSAAYCCVDPLYQIVLSLNDKIRKMLADEPRFPELKQEVNQFEKLYLKFREELILLKENG